MRPPLRTTQQRATSFQSTHPCGVRQCPKTIYLKDSEFQSTHPCGVRQNDFSFWKSTPVSIHAPVWGATFRSIFNSIISSFNPRTRVGCDPTIGMMCFYCLSFNPRTRVGCDSSHLSAIDQLSVSIHAPVWGATFCIHTIGGAFSFNPRTRVGCDDQREKFCCHRCVSIHAPVWGATQAFGLRREEAMFQSTHPCGVRQPIL